MNGKRRIIIKICAVAALFMVALSLVTGLVMPKYMTDLEEGSMISQYYDEAGGHEVIFIGDCEIYSNINPVILFEENGITSYLRSCSQQLVWQSYYVLEETFQYEIPKAVIFNVNAMKFAEPVKEEYNRLAMDYMRWSRSKIGMIKASMTEDESFLSYLFPILRYHSRIFELSSEDFQYLFTRKDNTVNGHLVNTGVSPMGNLPTKKKLANYTFSDTCMDYLDRIRTLCEENGVKLILMKAPSQYPYWYDEYEQQIEEYAENHGLLYYNFLECTDEIGLDFSTDTYDAGLHLNEAGAEKLTKYLGDILVNDVGGFTDYRENAETAELYAELREKYDILLNENN